MFTLLAFNYCHKNVVPHNQMRYIVRFRTATFKKFVLRSMLKCFPYLKKTNLKLHKFWVSDISKISTQQPCPERSSVN